MQAAPDGVASEESATDDFFESRAAAVDGGTATVREGLAELGRRGLPGADLIESIRLVRHVARSDMATAFSAWAHRMVIEYISLSPEDCSARAALPALSTADTLGATALAAGTVHVLAGAELPITSREDGDEIVLDGRIAWASNLIPPFLVVTAAAFVDDPSRTVVVAIPDGTAGLNVAPYPELLALQATGSSFVKIEGVRVPRSAIISEDLAAFARHVLPRFLLLQCAFCSGIAGRALDEATEKLGPMGDSIRPSLDETRAAVAEADAAIERLAPEAGTRTPTDEVLALRLRWSQLATEAVRLELCVSGGRGYMASSPTARRVREAAFLPIQAPTEVLLRWLLSRSA
jgi:alkylation response protein AidB-like acyl-CoA dehydrogenase